MKICTGCKNNKELKFFSKDKSHKDGLTSRCKQCIAEINQLNRVGRIATRKTYEKNNWDKISTKKKEYNEKQENKDRKKDQKLRAKFGITLEDYEYMVESQKGLCAICGVEQSGFKKVLSVDHDHNNGKIRGLLCHSCNVGLGMFLDNPTLLLGAIKYLSRNSS